MSAAQGWVVRRSRLPALLAAAMVAASGVAAMGNEGWLWWAGLVAVAAGLGGLAATLRCAPATLRLRVGERLRLETADGALLGEGRLDACSVVTPALIALRIRNPAGHTADLVLTPGSASADELRRLRVRLLGDETLRG